MRRQILSSVNAFDVESYIYVLHDPTDVSHRIYVGVTTKPRARLSLHLREARLGVKRFCCLWIASLLRRGTRPAMEIVETIPPGGAWAEAEQFWIAYFRSIGASLTNMTNGGEGSWGVRPSREAVERRVAHLRGRKRSAEFGAKISAAKKGQGKGRKLPPATRGKLSVRAHGASLRADNKTGYRGVFFRANRYEAKLGTNGRNGGRYATPEEAAVAYDRLAREAWGEEAALNFPFPGEKSARPGVEPQSWTDLPAPEHVKWRRLRSVAPVRK